jgi:hypothetical protein
MRDDDLRTELQFHIDLRTQRHINAGMAPGEAEALARKQFGDVEAAMTGMRMARMRSPKAAVLALMITSFSIAAIWFFAVLASSGPVVLPQLPEVPRQVKIQKRPPPPPPGPTWEQFVAKVNTFGDGKNAKRAPR